MILFMLSLTPSSHRGNYNINLITNQVIHLKYKWVFSDDITVHLEPDKKDTIVHSSVRTQRDLMALTAITATRSGLVFGQYVSPIPETYNCPN